MSTTRPFGNLGALQRRPVVAAPAAASTPRDAVDTAAVVAPPLVTVAVPFTRKEVLLGKAQRAIGRATTTQRPATRNRAVASPPRTAPRQVFVNFDASVSPFLREVSNGNMLSPRSDADLKVLISQLVSASPPTATSSCSDQMHQPSPASYATPSEQRRVPGHCTVSLSPPPLPRGAALPSVMAETQMEAINFDMALAVSQHQHDQQKRDAALAVISASNTTRSAASAATNYDAVLRRLDSIPNRELVEDVLIVTDDDSTDAASPVRRPIVFDASPAMFDAAPVPTAAVPATLFADDAADDAQPAAGRGSASCMACIVA